jgi:hypothetical protein
VETETTLVGAQGGVELDTETAVDLDLIRAMLAKLFSLLEGFNYLTLVILPDNAELNHALGDGDNLESLAVLGLLLEESGVLEGGRKLYSGWSLIS